MDQVAERAGVSKQTVYSHVANKEALFIEVVDGMTGGAGDALADRVPDPPDGAEPAVFLRGFAEGQLGIVLTPRLMQLRRLVIGEVGRFPELGAVLHARGPRRSIHRLAGAIAAFARMGRLKADDPVAAAGYFNWLIMGGPVNDAMLLGDDAIPDADMQARHAAECVRIFMAAYGYRGAD